MTSRHMWGPDGQGEDREVPELIHDPPVNGLQLRRPTPHDARDHRQSSSLRKSVHQCVLGLGEIKPVHGFGESQVGIDARNEDACINGQQLDPYKGHPDIDVDHQALVQDGVDDIGEAARCGAIKVSVTRSTLCNGRELKLSSGALIGRWLARLLHSRRLRQLPTHLALGETCQCLHPLYIRKRFDFRNGCRPPADECGQRSRGVFATDHNRWVRAGDLRLVNG
jgi:hypothetical protein